MSSSHSSAANDRSGGISILTVHPDIIQSHVLNRLDGTALVSTSCASSTISSLCKEDRLWRDICNSTWPSTTHPRVRHAISSFPSSHQSFYCDTFPSVRHGSLRRQNRAYPLETSELISAVDIHYGDKLLYSKVLETETLSGWFSSSPFRLELFHPKETAPAPFEIEGEGSNCISTAEERLRISWILVDPTKKRAVNVASQRAVEARRHWLNDDIQMRFATVVTDYGGDLVQCAVVATCGGNGGGKFRLKEVAMQVEDMEGKILSGMDSLGILQAAMDGRRCKNDGKMEREIYEKYTTKKEQFRERKQRREMSLDRMVIAIGVTIFVAILIFLLFT